MNGDSRCIVLTGVSRGLGRAMTAGFIQRGHRVCGCSRSAAALAELRKHWPEHDFQQVDVSDDAAVSAWAQHVLSAGAVPDLLVNNAALINGNAPLWEIPDQEMAQLLDVNIRGTVNVIRHFVPAMIERGGGVIVNFSSGWGRSVAADVAPYCATKWAIEGLTKALAEELPAGMAAVPLNPGVINTEMLQSCFAEGAHSYPGPESWAERAVPYLLGLGAAENGRSLSVP